LEKLYTGVVVNDVFRKECILGTIIHLEVLWAFLEIFYGRETMYEKVMLASFVTRMLYYGIVHTSSIKNGHTIRSNWMNRDICMDCHIACHATINYIRIMKNNYPHLPCPLCNIGLDCCDNFSPSLGNK